MRVVEPSQFSQERRKKPSIMPRLLVLVAVSGVAALGYFLVSRNVQQEDDPASLPVAQDNTVQNVEGAGKSSERNAG